MYTRKALVMWRFTSLILKNIAIANQASLASDKSFAHSDVLEHFESPCMNGEGASRSQGVGSRINPSHIYPSPQELVRHDDAGRSGADNQYICFRIHSDLLQWDPCREQNSTGKYYNRTI